MTADELLDIRRAVMGAVAFLVTLRRGPDGELRNGGLDWERLEKRGQRVVDRLMAAAEVLGREVSG